ANVPSHVVKTGGKPFDAVVTASGYAFVSLTTAIAVFRTAGPEPSGVRVILRGSALGEALTHNQKYLLVTGHSGLTVFRVRDLEKIRAGCGPDRVAVSGDGRTVWVSDGGGNAVVAFAAGKLLSDPAHALLARVAVGQRPLGLVLVNHGAQLIVADSNRDKAP